MPQIHDDFKKAILQNPFYVPFLFIKLKFNYMNSKELRKQAESVENDLKAMGLYTKVLREERAERFENYKDKLLQAGYNLTEYESQGKITIEPTNLGIVDYYPKSNKVLIRKENKWITGGLRWIIGSLLNGL